MSVTAQQPDLPGTQQLTRLEYAWVTAALANYGAALVWQSWESLGFRLVWIGLVAAYGLLVLHADRVLKVMFALGAAVGLLMLLDATHVLHLWADPVDTPPVMALMCLVLLWNIGRHQDALRSAGLLSEQQRSLLERQERFVQDASHELRTPLTIAQGHLELLRSRYGADHDLEVALDEMTRLEGIIERLLLLAAADQPDFLIFKEVELEPLLEDIFIRWIDIAPRSWRLGPVPPSRVGVDPERIRTALDALLENAVKHTEDHATIELRARESWDGRLILEVADDGHGVPADALEQIFARFGRADAARSRSRGGVGLGLAIVDAIVKAHGGTCGVRSSARGTVFSIELPAFHAAAPADGEPELVAPPPSPPPLPAVS
ncbi:MAG TPA: ATP-binding protein [Solirubrobacteraceae bacterium]|nr:ATP-binding protein [Solirubrobacteraceae bacterium]